MVKGQSEDCAPCDWKESRQYIRSELTRIAKMLEDLKDELRKLRESLDSRESRIQDMIKAMDLRFEALYAVGVAERARQNVEIARLGVKATVLGGIAGAVPVMIMVLWELLRSHAAG